MYSVKRLNEKLIKSYETVFGFNPLLARLLVSKGFTGNDVIEYLMPQQAIINPNALVNGLEAVNRIEDFVHSKPNGVIWIYSDYDSDGMTSSVIMKYALESFIKDLNGTCTVKVFLPDRSYGYGIGAKWASETFLDSNSMVITVDNGTNAVEAVNVLNERGIPVIVTDHHQPEEVIANCLIINPNLHEQDPHKHLAGCGVAFKLGMLMIGFERMQNVIDFLAVGTIGDMMEMTNENIAFCKLGLERINKNECYEGFKLLKAKNDLTFKDIAFEIVPKLNACGRMNRMDIGYDFLFNVDSEVAVNLECLNEKRKANTKKFTKEAESQNSYVVKLKDCFVGLAGVIAGKLSQSLRANVIVFAGSDKTLIGSGRAYGNSSILEQIQSLMPNYETLFASGHKEACGVRINEKEFDLFAKDFNAMQSVLNTYEESKQEMHYIVDAELNLEDVNPETLRIISSLPYDKKDRQEPIFAIKANLVKFEEAKNNANCWIYLESGKKKLNKIWGDNLTYKFKNLKKKKDLVFIATIQKNFMMPDQATISIIDIVA